MPFGDKAETVFLVKTILNLVSVQNTCTSQWVGSLAARSFEWPSGHDADLSTCPRSLVKLRCARGASR